MRVLCKSKYLFCNNNNKSRIPYNINQEQHKQYLQKLQKSQELLDQNVAVQSSRRNKRIYDRPKYDKCIKGYGAWRVYNHEEAFYKPFQHSHQVLPKVMLQPKWLLHGFGIGCIPFYNRRNATKQFIFVDNKMNMFLLFDYRMTTRTKPNIEGFDYENQDHIRPAHRKTKRMSHDEFWESEDYCPFRLNSCNYGEHYKFREWIRKEVQKRKSQKSYDQQIDEKFGKVLTFNNYNDHQFFQPNKPMITQVKGDHFTAKKPSKVDLAELQLGIKMDEKFKIVKEDKTQNKKQ